MQKHRSVEEDKGHLMYSFYIACFSVLLLWGIRALEVGLESKFYWLGIYPRTLKGLFGLIGSGLVHKDIFHLASNSLPLFMGVFMTIYYYRKIAMEVFLWIYFSCNLWVWVLARPAYHIGISGFIYGILSFLFFSGIFRRNRRLMTVSLIIVFMYGSMIWGVLPIKDGVSWESHSAGAIVGLILAFYFRRVGKLKMTHEENPLHYWTNTNDSSITPIVFHYSIDEKKIDISNNEEENLTL